MLLDQFGDSLCVWRGDLFHVSTRGWPLAGSQRFGLLDIGCVIAARHVSDLVFAGVGQNVELVADCSTDGAGISGGLP